MICIYCQCRIANTKDHVPPKQLLRRPLPSNLITVPSCTDCNAGFSKDEEYFRLTIIGLLCHAPEAEQVFDGPMSRSMDRLRHLEDLMFGSIAAEDGQVRLVVDNDRVFRVADKIARGLCFAVLRIPRRPEAPYSFRFDEVDAPSSVQTFAPDFSYELLDVAGLALEFTLFDSVRFYATAQ